MKKSLLIIIAASFLFVSCGIISGSDDDNGLNFVAEQTIANSETITVYKSMNYIAVWFSTDTNGSVITDLAGSYNLQPVRGYTHDPFLNFEALILPAGSFFVFRLPSGADATSFHSFTPGLSAAHFPNHELVDYAMPAYAYSPDQAGWFYPTNRLSVASDDPDFNPEQLAEQFGLEYEGMPFENLDVHRFVDNRFEHGSPYSLSLKIMNSGDFRYAHPSAYHLIEPHGR